MGVSSVNRVDVLNQAEQLINGPRAKDYGDSWLDAAGYIALGGEIATENKIK